MKRNRFRLATVLRVRMVQEDVELGRLAHARADARRASESAALSFDRYAVRSQQLSSSSTTSFLADREHMDRLADSVLVSRAKVEVADEVVHERHVDWSHAAQRVSALGRLRDRHNDAFVATALLEEVADADERATARGRISKNPQLLPPSPVAAEPR